MRTYQYTAFIVLDGYDILYGGHKSDAGVEFYIYMSLASPQRCETYS
jgi:hypothetical protein